MSELVKAVSYNAETEELLVRLASGKTYNFKDVPPLVYKNFAKAESQGTFFNDFIRDKYDFQRVVDSDVLEGPNA